VACCTDEALVTDITDTCQHDCGYAACKTAIASIRAAAVAIEAPDGLPEGPFNTSKSDLFAYANFLETQEILDICANRVRNNPGKIVSVGLNSGASSPGALGHINDATIFLSCALDPDEPYLINPTALTCTEATNITTTIAEHHAQGPITAGAITVTSAGVDALVPMIDASVSTRERLTSDLSVDFTIMSFDATVLDTTIGSFSFRDTQIHLAAPASGTLTGETATFAPGTLRLEITSSVAIDGLSLFDGLPITAQYSNKTTATAMRGSDGSFQLVQASFANGEHTAVLHTEPSRLHRADLL
jgi:hypothetical protein